MKRIMAVLSCVFLTGATVAFYFGCAPFRDSPFSDQLFSSETNLNARAIERLTNIEADGHITLAIFADVHQNYSDLDNVIYEVNQTPHVDFVANLGDFTNSGYNLEYDQFLDSYTSFRAPAMTATGNHDAIGAGPQLYAKVFGSPNFWFESSSHRFIFFNSANLENPEGFSPEWLKNAVDTSTKPIFIFTHCSLLDPERFAGSTAALFTSIIQDSKVQMVLNGHNHVYLLTVQNGTTLLQIPRVQGNAWVLLELIGQQLTITQKPEGTKTVITLKP